MTTVSASLVYGHLSAAGGEYGRLMTQHEELLRESAIDPEVARERGYFSAISASDLKAVGLPTAVSTWVDAGCGCCGPSDVMWGKAPLSHGLAFPIRNINGDIAFHMLRPDRPRLDRNFKPVKYERPPGSRNVLDVHPRVREQLLDLAMPLYITEGTRKVDAAVSAGLSCIGVLGVWAWRCRTDTGQSVPLDEFDSIPLDGRQVVIVFDSDVMTKESPRWACRGLRDLLASRGSAVKVLLLPAGPDGSKIGLDDFLAAGGSVEELGELVLPGRKIRKRRNRYSQGSRSDILEQIHLAIRLLQQQKPDRLVVRMLMDGFGVSEKTARSRVKGARGEIDATRHPRIASAARLANLNAKVTDRRSSYIGEEEKSLLDRRGKSLASSRGDAVSPERRDVDRHTNGGEGRRKLSSFSFPLMEVDPASVTLERTCEECVQPFTPQRSDARYCSNACRQRAYRERTVSVADSEPSQLERKRRFAKTA
jgi:hypothetical protein